MNNSFNNERSFFVIMKSESTWFFRDRLLFFGNLIVVGKIQNVGEYVAGLRTINFAAYARYIKKIEVIERDPYDLLKGFKIF